MYAEGTVHIRSAEQKDMPSVAQLIRELAVFEKAEDEAELDAEDLIKDGFGENPSFRCLVAEREGVIIGMALYYERYSTWKGKTLYLEDLVVKADSRRLGVGKKLFKALRDITREGGYKRLEWQVLNWNTAAIAFYNEEKSELDETWINGRINFD